jgi:Holliday junction resolvase RusA-like endonuclease
MEKYIIPLKLPSLNDYIRACRSDKYVGAKMKSRVEQEIGLYLMKMPKHNKPIKINFTWVESSKRRDLDNVCFAKKFILDAMVKYGKLEDDNRKHVTGFVDKFVYGDKNEVILEIEEV